MKRVGDDATIRWYGPLVPNVGDVLRTPTGRQYLVTECAGRTGRALKCIVMPNAKTYAPSTPVRSMRWMKRKPKGLR
jgi:hypothetical protein